MGPLKLETSQPSPEFKLAVECCRRSFAGDDGTAPLPVQGIDWDRFMRLIRFHRIEGLAWNGLSPEDSGLSNDCRPRLNAAASEIAVRNLQMSAESQALQKCFERESIPLLFLKGAGLGALAYGNPQLKAAIDIDLLIDPDDLHQAARTMRSVDYQLVVPANSSGNNPLQTWHNRSKETVWIKKSPPFTQVDLHTRTADNPRLIPGIDVHSPRQSVAIGNGVSLPTFAAHEQFAYLSVHGASSAWFRLKWISDFAALLHSKDAAEIDRLYRRSQELGAGRAAGQAMLLADALFETLADSPGLREELMKDRSIRRLYRTALGLVTGEPFEPTDTRGGTLPIHWTQFLLMPGLTFKITELIGQSRRAFNRGLN